MRKNPDFTAVLIVMVSSLISISARMAIAGPKAITPPTVTYLRDEQVNAAIERGIHGKPRAIGVTMIDMQTSLLSAMACTYCAVSGYSITVLTPEEFIESQAALARKEMKPFTLSDVTPEMRQPLLHVFAMPSRASYISGAGLSMASSVHRVVMTDANKGEIIQPVDSTNGTVEDNSALRSFTYQSAGATFAMTDVVHLREKDAKGEFYIVVVGDNQNKYFKVKERYARLLFR